MRDYRLAWSITAPRCLAHFCQPRTQVSSWRRSVGEREDPMFSRETHPSSSKSRVSGGQAGTGSLVERVASVRVRRSLRLPHPPERRITAISTAQAVSLNRVDGRIGTRHLLGFTFELAGPIDHRLLMTPGTLLIPPDEQEPPLRLPPPHRLGEQG